MSATSFGRALRDGLSRLRRRAAARLAPSGFNPSREERCELCRFWEVNRYGGVGGPHCDGSASNCRRHAPRHMKQDGRVSANVEWITTGRNDWCGDFEPR